MSSTLKRRLKRIRELNEIKERLRSNLPNLDERQIRRHRIPYHEALYLELVEDGYFSSADYINRLMKYQNEFRSKSDKESPIMKKPLLQDSKDTLKSLYIGFRDAENGSRQFQKNIEIDSLLNLGTSFAGEDDSWWWLADQILLQSLHEASEYRHDGEHRHALIRFHYGRFLLNRLNSLDEAAEHLRICRELSAGHKWLVSDFIKSSKESNNLHKQCCILLNDVLLKQAELYMNDDPVKATKLCQTAVKIITEVQDQKTEARALFQLGLCEMKVGQYKEAVSKFLKVLMVSFSTNNLTAICETRIQLALASFAQANVRDTKYHLNQLLQFAMKNNLKYYEGLAHKYLGECYLTYFNPQEATPHLLKALEIFHEMNNDENRESSKNIAAVAAALQLVMKYRELILDSGHKDPIIAQENMMKLLHWKDNREIFWTENIVIEDTAQPPPSYTTDENVEEHWEQEEVEQMSGMDVNIVSDIFDTDEQDSEIMEVEN